MYLPLSPEIASGAAQFLVLVIGALGVLVSFLWTAHP
jgi:hypothetical protein